MKIHAVSVRRRQPYTTRAARATHRSAGKSAVAAGPPKREQISAPTPATAAITSTLCSGGRWEEPLVINRKQDILQFHPAIRPLVAILHDHRRIQRQSPLRGFPFCNRARPRNHNRIPQEPAAAQSHSRDKSRLSRCRTAASIASESRLLPAPLALPPACLHRCRSCRPPAPRPPR